MSRPLSQIARQKAIDAAQAVVAENGIAGFTVDGVARRSGVAKTTLYRHWKSGTALLAHALDCHLEPLPEPDTGTLRGDLAELLASVVSHVTGPRRQMILEMASAAAKDPELAAVKRAMTWERTRPVRRIVARAVARGEIPAVDPTLASRYIQGPVLAWVLDADDSPSPADIGRLADLLARGLGAVVPARS